MSRKDTIYYFVLYFSSTALMSRKDSLKKKIHVYIYREPGVVIPHQTLTAAPARALSARLCYLQQQHLQQRAEQRLHSLLEDPQRSGIGHVYSSLKTPTHLDLTRLYLRSDGRSHELSASRRRDAASYVTWC